MKEVKKIEPNFSYYWNDGDTYGEVSVECSCGCRTEFGMVDSYETMECRCCGKKYRIRYKEWLEEI